MLLLNFLLSDQSSTAIEYALIGGLIFLVIIAGVTALSQKVFTLYSTISSNV